MASRSRDSSSSVSAWARRSDNNCAAYGRQRAHPFNGQFALLPVYLPDLLVDGLPEFCSRFRRFSSMRSKAPLKKSSSSACRATRRSSSAMRRRCRSSALLLEPRFRPWLRLAAESFPLKPVQLPAADTQFQRQRARCPGTPSSVPVPSDGSPRHICEDGPFSSSVDPAEIR